MTTAALNGVGGVARDLEPVANAAARPVDVALIANAVATVIIVVVVDGTVATAVDLGLASDLEPVAMQTFVVSPAAAMVGSSYICRTVRRSAPVFVVPTWGAICEGALDFVEAVASANAAITVVDVIRIAVESGTMAVAIDLVNASHLRGAFTQRVVVVPNLVATDLMHGLRLRGVVPPAIVVGLLPRADTAAVVGATVFAARAAVVGVEILDQHRARSASLLDVDPLRSLAKVLTNLELVIHHAAAFTEGVVVHLPGQAARFFASIEKMTHLARVQHLLVGCDAGATNEFAVVLARAVVESVKLIHQNSAAVAANTRVHVVMKGGISVVVIEEMQLLHIGGSLHSRPVVRIFASVAVALVQPLECVRDRGDHPIRAGLVLAERLEHRVTHSRAVSVEDQFVGSRWRERCPDRVAELRISQRVGRVVGVSTAIVWGVAVAGPVVREFTNPFFWTAAWHHGRCGANVATLWCVCLPSARHKRVAQRRRCRLTTLGGSDTHVSIHAIVCALIVRMEKFSWRVCRIGLHQPLHETVFGETHANRLLMKEMIMRLPVRRRLVRARVVSQSSTTGRQRLVMVPCVHVVVRPI